MKLISSIKRFFIKKRLFFDVNFSLRQPKKKNSVDMTLTKQTKTQKSNSKILLCKN
jgi:hypothetical protein